MRSSNIAPAKVTITQVKMKKTKYVSRYINYSCQLESGVHINGINEQLKSASGMEKFHRSSHSKPGGGHTAGSYPDPPQGVHLQSLQAVIIVPLPTPYSVYASIAYAEHVG